MDPAHDRLDHERLCSSVNKPGYMLENPSIRWYSIWDRVKIHPVRTISREDPSTSDPLRDYTPGFARDAREDDIVRSAWRHAGSQDRTTVRIFVLTQMNGPKVAKFLVG